MKRLLIYLLVSLLISCTGNKDMSPSETAKVVAESFYHGDKASLKKYTTAEGYANLSSIQEMFVQDKNSKSDFKVVDEVMEGEVAWIKYSTAYDPKPGVFKLIKEDKRWKVTHNGPRDNGPF
ncbi:MAG: hypothetical protein CMC74_00105 [Flavobacteriaceae bacterium]|nr:hypothetical protein [Flavobacteriaceae bacterium]